MAAQGNPQVVVLGLGPGGEEVATQLAKAGMSVTAVEAELVGGECPYWGCVPSKMMVRGAGLVAEARRVPGMAGLSQVQPDLQPVAARIRAEATDDWDDTAAVERLSGDGVMVLRGRGRLIGPRRVEVDGTRLTAQRGVVIATGTVPAIPPIDGLANTPYWTNRQAVQARTAPTSLVVLGGGAIGVELAQVFARFGSRVTVVEAADHLLPLEEPSAGQLLRDVLTREELQVHVGTFARRVSHQANRFVVTTDAGEVAAEQVLVATGRRARLDDIGLDTVGLDPKARAIDVDGQLRAGDGLWAVGDVTGKGAFTHVAVYQGRIAARDILGNPGPPAEYHALPRVTFTDPEVGAVGLTQAQARDAGLSIRTGTTQVPSTARGWIHKAGNDGFITVIEDVASGVLVGATSVGPVGGEVLGLLSVAVRARVPVDQLVHMIYAYPTFHRGIEDALRDLRN